MTSTAQKVTITLPFEVDTNNLWYCVFGSGFETWAWWTGVRYIEGDWDQVGVVEISHCDYEDDEPEVKTYTLTLDNIVDAISALVAQGYRDVTHSVVDGDFDACTGDAVIQQACFGEVVFG